MLSKFSKLSVTNTIRYDTIEEFNVDSKAEYSNVLCGYCSDVQKLVLRKM